MKRLNYYQVHKNKIPKRKKSKVKFNPLRLKILLVSTMSALKVKKIISQPFLDKTNKAYDIALETINSYNAIKSILKEEKKLKYLNRLKK